LLFFEFAAKEARTVERRRERRRDAKIGRGSGTPAPTPRL
jgi:hypothetical protein